MDSTYLVFRITNNAQKSQILATGVALLFGVIINLLFTGLIEIFGSWSDQKPQFKYRYRDNVSRHVFLFAIGCVLSCCSLPGLHGIFQTIMAWLCLVILIVLHIIYVMSSQNISKFRSITTLVYYAFITIWFFGIIVSFFKLSSGVYN